MIGALGRGACIAKGSSSISGTKPVGHLSFRRSGRGLLVIYCGKLRECALGFLPLYFQLLQPLLLQIQVNAMNTSEANVTRRDRSTFVRANIMPVSQVREGRKKESRELGFTWNGGHYRLGCTDGRNKTVI